MLNLTPGDLHGNRVPSIELQLQQGGLAVRAPSQPEPPEHVRRCSTGTKGMQSCKGMNRTGAP